MDIDILNINNFDINKLVFSKVVNLNPYKKKISIGYNNLIDLYILTPLFTNSINFNLNSKISFIKLSFDPLLGDILKFYNIVNEIEDNINKNILKLYPNYELSSILKFDKNDIDIFQKIDNEDDNNNDNNYIKYMYLSLDSKNDYTYKIFDDNNHETNINQLKLGSKFKSIIKIDYIWIDIKKKKFGLNINLIQLKFIQPIYQIKCLFDDTVIQNNKSIILKKELNINESDTNIKTQSPKKEIENKSVFIPPDPRELLKMKNLLKKVNE